MSKNIAMIKLGDEIANTLTQYGAGLQKGVNEAARKAGKDLVKKTKATAPIRTGNYKKAITMTEEITAMSCRVIWHVKPPHHRLTHLLVHGHATRDGGRTKGEPFLQNAVDQVLPQFEQDVVNVITKGG